jgi:hypothetical protein
MMRRKEERTMSPRTQTPPANEAFVYPADVLEYAEKHNVAHGLEPLREATMRLFPTGTLKVTFEPDPETSDLDAIVFEMRVKAEDVPNYMEARNRWFDEFVTIYRPPYTLKEPLCSLRRI